MCCCGGGESDDGDHCEEEKDRENGEEWELFHEVATFEGGGGRSLALRRGAASDETAPDLGVG